ncbi:MAG: ATP-binding protein [Treponema sp.]|nr:ATP-binding protein [Treponema sp.]
MEVQTKPKKIRWNIATTMAVICNALRKSRLNIRTTQNYNKAMERLATLYNLTKVQIWILCLSCERAIDKDDTGSIRDFAEILNTSAMSILSWKKDISILKDKGFLESCTCKEEFQPTKAFCNSLIDNTSFIPEPKHEIDEIEFLNNFGKLYGSRSLDDITCREIRSLLCRYEDENKQLEMIKRVKSSIKFSFWRFIIYDVANDVLRGINSGLDCTLSDIFEGAERYDIAKEMLNESHELFKQGYLEFVDKGNVAEASFTLTEKAKKLVLGEKAVLFEDSINRRNLITKEDIKEKKLYYSEENKKEIERLKKALQEDKLHSIQKRLQEDGLPIGIAVLLYGAPGTGKTESVMQIAKATGRDIVHVDISEAKSAWFGESEKLIKKIFTSYKHECESAEKKGVSMPILLFNEADALISKRKDASAGNCAQTENAIQNIILEELENLKGIFIATTNLASNMDSAIERRFLFKIKFENPSTEAKTSIWMNKLTWLDKNSAVDFAQSYDFSGGQIDNIVRKIALNEVINGERPAISEIHDMCKCEKIENTNYSKHIGFNC